MNKLHRTNIANALFYIPKPAVILLPVLLRGLTVILTGGVWAWFASAWVDLLFLAGIVFYVLLRWNGLRYRMEEELLVLRLGLFRQQVRLIPTENISAVTAVRPFWLRVFQVFLIQADTPAGGMNQADFRLYLSGKEAARLFQNQAGQALDYPVEHLYRPRNTNILLLSLFTSNSLAGLLLMAAFIRNLGDIIGRELSYQVFSTLDNIGRLLAFGIPPAAAVMGYTILLGWGVAFLAEFFRNKNFTAVRTSGVFSMYRGLLSLQNYSVQVDKINYIDIRSTLFSHLLRLGAVYLHSTGLLAGRQDIIPIVPVVTRQSLEEILKELLPEFSPAENTLAHNPGALFRFIGDALAAVFGVGAAFWLVQAWRPEWLRFTLYIALMALLPCIWLLLVRLLDYRTAGVARQGDTYTLRYSKGFYLHTVVLPRERIVSVQARQSIFQLLDGRCDLFITTYSQGQARHRLRNLELQAAGALFGLNLPPPKKGKTK